MPNKLADLANNILTLELEERKLELEKRIAQLKADRPIDEECVGCCRVQCDTELIERLSTEIHNRDKTIKEYKETIRVERMGRGIEKASINHKYSEDLRKKNATIEELKDRNIEDLHELYDLYEKELSRFKHVISARDLTIKSLTTMCQSSGTERNRLTKELRSAKSDYEIMRTNHYNTVAKLREDIRGLEVELSVCKEDSAVLMKVVDAIRAMTEDARTCPQIDHLSLIVKDYLDAPEGPPEVKTTMFEVEHPVDRSRTIHLQKMRIDEQKQTIENLKADSEVLMKVVEITSDWGEACDTLQTHRDAMYKISDLVDDYTDAPEGPPETNIDDLYKVTVTYAFLEMP